MNTPTSPDKPPPQWMLLLEKKKNRPHRLAHEIGAGAPCLACGDKCPGLDLHFWRKVCRNCKCKKEEHDVKDDDGYEQFEILLGAGNRRKKPGAVLKIKVPDVDAVVSNKQFDWVPPNVSDDVAAEYMQQLPAAKLPISGSDGALYRRQQLEKQMPLHDLDAARCHNLTPQEIEQLQKYLDNLKHNVVGQGRVTKIPGLYLEQRHWYGAPGMEQTSSTLLPSSRSDQSLHPLPPLPHLYNSAPRPFKAAAHDEDQPPPLPDSLPPDHDAISLRTPGSFIPASQKPYGGSLASSQHPSDLAYSAQGVGQNPNASEPFRTDVGSTMSSQFPSSISMSSKVPGTFIPGQESSMKQTGSHARYPDGSAIYSSNQLNSANSSTAPGRFVPEGTIPSNLNNDYSKSDFSKDGSAIHSHGQSNVANSSEVSGQFYPGQNQNYGQSGNIPGTFYPEDGSTIHSHGQSNVANSSEVSGQFYPGQNQNYGQSGNIPGTFYPEDGLAIHSHGQPNVANSSEVSGQFYPGQSLNYEKSGKIPGTFNSKDNSAIQTHDQYGNAYSSGMPGQFNAGQNQTPNIPGSFVNASYPTDGSLNFSQDQANAANSSKAGGQFYPGENQNYGPPGNFPNSFNPKDGSALQSHGQSNIANSSGIGGKFYPGENQYYGQSGNIPINANEGSDDHLHERYNPADSSGARGQNSHNYENVAFSKDGTPNLAQNQYNVANSSNVPGQFYPGPKQPSNRDVDSSGVIGAAAQGKGGNLSSSETGRDWPNASQAPMPARFEHSSVPLGLASSSDIGGDSMPRSAQIIHQRNVVDDELASQLELLSAKEHPVGSGLSCRRCEETLAAGEVAVFADRAGPDAAWHPRCFACRTCSELLADLVYFFGRGDVYCGRHYAELLDIPRCRACDELIFVKEYTVAEGQTFHVKHFCCYECDEPLAGKQYVPVDEMPTCLDCYQEIFGKRCNTCLAQIPAGHQRVGWKDLNWHATPNCFRCDSCLTSLLGRKFVMRDRNPFCDKNCADKAIN